jgi:hypothetical protein
MIIYDKLLLVKCKQGAASNWFFNSKRAKKSGSYRKGQLVMKLPFVSYCRSVYTCKCVNFGLMILGALKIKAV